MHIEKNICDNIIGTLLNIEGKTKDTINARLDMIDMNIRRALHLHRDETSLVKKYPTIYTLSPHQRQSFCEFLKSVKFSYGYAANISKNVKEGGKLSVLKSHDCHVLLQRLLPVGIRLYLPKRLEVDIVFILCKLEKIFPRAFFDVMVYLAVYLPHEAKLVGPVGYQCMYSIERMLGKLRGYVRNRARPEGSIVEGYISNESLTFCSMPVWWLQNGSMVRVGNGISLLTRVKTLSKQGLGVATNELSALAYGPDKRVDLYTGCVVNGVRWHVKHIEETRTTQNSGVIVSRTRGDQQSNFYGQLVNVVKIGFQDGYHVILFKHDLYVLAKQAQQIFYLDDPKLGSGWEVIQKIRHRHVWDVPENEATHEVETIYDERVDQDGEDIVITSRDENDLPSTSLRRDDAEPKIVEEDISLEPIEVDGYEEGFTNDDSIEEQLSGNESNSVHSDDYSDLD
ncbi:PREDICTED: transposon [Prunus dulcis]|uniref:PREDICTED: transposon n=1 Tax=Prunus dulcis TaxID=3755 RepID=A0A5E4FXM8_PRUDU|nr:PREDICTED: transposon [Prunus dulcis]